MEEEFKWEEHPPTVEFMNRLYEKQPKFKDILLIPKDKYVRSNLPVIFENKYGLIRVRPAELLRGCVSTIVAAVDKNLYCINQFIEIHGDNYKYPNLNYKTKKEKVEIECPVHGTFYQDPQSHLKGHGCSKCGAKIHMNSNEEVLRIVKEFGRKDFMYKTDNISMLNRKIDVECPLGHKFQYKTSDIRAGYGCPRCSSIMKILSYKFKEIKTVQEAYEIKGYFYVLEFMSEKELFWKVGMTTSMNRRLREIVGESSYKVKQIYLQECNLVEASEKEDYMLETFKDYRYKPQEKFGGHTECLAINPIKWLDCEAEEEYQKIYKFIWKCQINTLILYHEIFR